MSKKAKLRRTVQGLCDFAMDKIEELERDDNQELCIATRIRLHKRMLDSIYKGLAIDIAHKRLRITAPAVATSAEEVPVGARHKAKS